MGVKFVYVLPFSWKKRETYNPNSPGNLRNMPGQSRDNPGTIPGNVCLCVLLFIGFFWPEIRNYQDTKSLKCLCQHYQDILGTLLGQCKDTIKQISFQKRSWVETHLTYILQKPKKGTEGRGRQKKHHDNSQQCAAFHDDFCLCLPLT